jgi:hypothetical protein
MYSGTRKGSFPTARRFVVASAIAAVVTAAFLPGSGFGSSAAAVRGAHMRIPAGLAKAIHARFGARTIRSSSASDTIDPELGLAVSLSADGTTALVGAPGVAGDVGAAYIFHSSAAGSWSSSGKPTATLTKHGAKTGLLGISVALSPDGTTAFVGAPLSGSGLFGAGAVYVFHASAENAWASSSSPKATLTVKNSVFVGISLALSADGTTLVAGAPFFNMIAGGAYVFQAASESAWATSSTPAATLSNAAESDDDGFAGSTVAISGDGMTALLGDAGNATGGGAFLFHASAENAWATSVAPTAILTDSESGPDDALGDAVALSADGSVALLGAPGAFENSGSADVFYSSGAWSTTSTPTAVMTQPSVSPGDEFGVNLALSNDGTTALMFAPGHSSGRGAAYIFSTSGESAWASSSAPDATLTDSAGKAKDELGVGVLSADGATAIVGIPGVKLATGAADIFHVADETSWATSSSPSARLTDTKLAACVVPKLKGLKLKAAKDALAVGRCGLGKVGHVHSKTKKGRGRVLSQSKKAGKRLAIGAKVSIKLGK